MKIPHTNRELNDDFKFVKFFEELPKVYLQLGDEIISATYKHSFKDKDAYMRHEAIFTGEVVFKDFGKVSDTTLTVFTIDTWILKEDLSAWITSGNEYNNIYVNFSTNWFLALEVSKLGFFTVRVE